MVEKDRFEFWALLRGMKADKPVAMQSASNHNLKFCKRIAPAYYGQLITASLLRCHWSSHSRSLRLSLSPVTLRSDNRLNDSVDRDAMGIKETPRKH